MAGSNEYDLKRVQVTLFGVRLSGSGKGAAKEFVTIEPNADLHTKQVGADGFSIYSSVGDKSAKATFKVLRGSKAYQLLGQMMAAQLRTSTRTPANFIVFDPISGDRVTSQFAIFMKRPSMGFAEESGEAEFMLDLPNAVWTYGANIQ